MSGGLQLSVVENRKQAAAVAATSAACMLRTTWMLNPNLPNVFATVLGASHLTFPDASSPLCVLPLPGHSHEPLG